MSEPDEGIGGAWEQLQDQLDAADRVHRLLDPDAPQPAVGGLPASWVEDLRYAPLIIDTDLGGDPDDAFALVAAARTCPELALVLTTDETGADRAPGLRARFARWLLDELGRGDVAVTAGARLGPARHYCVDGLFPESVPAQDSDVPAAVRAVCAATRGPVRWVGLGPMSNLAAVLERAPELAGRLRLTQMGGSLDGPDQDRVEHNIGLDVAAARRVLAAVRDGSLAVPRFVGLDVTLDPALVVVPGDRLHRLLDPGTGPGWAQVLARHLERWVHRHHPQTFQHDPLALSVALGLPFVHADRIGVRIDETGSVHRDADGAIVRWATEAEPGALMAWLARALDPQVPPG